VLLIEDTCESLGSVYKDKKTGNFGLISTFSLYFGHHLSTIEGGMVCTDDDEIADLLRSIRSHGWDRDLSDAKKDELRSKYGIDSFRALYNFYYPGFNVRATDLQAFIGLGQLQKADGVVAARRKNLQLYSEHIRNDHWKIQELDDTLVSNFCYPIISPKLPQLVGALHENGIETRPLVCGSITRHPFWYERYGHQSLPFADEVHDFGLYLPNNHEMTESEIEFVCSVVNKAIYD
ncbi:MAG: DegT/DnrJ/EryC1/StrS family aminotransferase, partial [Pyrinomonadaceae bacterium]|nr:DegT/DnrJ/EryC1/StrS family aminotransferase [Pyrinomonadaceae bacterium]